MLLKDKVAIVTGGGKGIGKAIAREFTAQGAAVVLAARTLSALQQTAAELEAMGGRALVIQTDVTNPAQVAGMVAQAVKTFGQVDILVNNSGVAGPTCEVMNLNVDEWNEVIAVDLTGAMLCSKEALKVMVPRKTGNIIMVGAEGGRTGDGRSGYPMRSPYCCAKMGLIGLTETLSQEVGKYNIRVNCISAAAVRGERFLNVIGARAKAIGVPVEELIKKSMEKYSLGRPVEEAELAKCALFLASDMASAVTGQVLVSHCGQHL